jgi:hypothetical protein
MFERSLKVPLHEMSNWMEMEHLLLLKMQRMSFLDCDPIPVLITSSIVHSFPSLSSSLCLIQTKIKQSVKVSTAMLSLLAFPQKKENC